VEKDIIVIKENVAELKTDVSELKEEQKRIEKEVRLNTVAINEIVSEQFRTKIRVDELERASV
jgi:6-phosphofructokinase